MAGVAITSPPTVVPGPSCFNLGWFPIKANEVINAGDAVSLDSNGQIVLAIATSAPAEPDGFAVFTDEYGTKTSKTGVAALTVGCSIYQQITLKNMTTNHIASLAAGDTLWLGVAPTTAAVGFARATRTNAADRLYLVGKMIDATTAKLWVSHQNQKYQTGATTTVING